MRKPPEKAAEILDATVEEIEDFRYRMALDYRDGKKAWEVMQASPKTLFFLHEDGRVSDERGVFYDITIH